ncbi:hypothetical protein AB0F07_39295 [Streptomyces fructofermentans]|uniref:hypothetical protein n=1 Tax=Streptomyces fructofermentans TaxID=152141 RepID=UPI0033F6C63C
MTGGELTLGAVLARLEEREREIAAQAEAAREKIAELTAQLEALDTAAEEIRITRKALRELPEPAPLQPPAAKLTDHPAYQQIMAVFAAADGPLRARGVCEAMDLTITPSNVNNVRLKLKRLVGRGILVEAEQGLFTQPRPQQHRNPAIRPSGPGESAKRPHSPYSGATLRIRRGHSCAR